MSELVAIGKRLEELERPKAVARQRAHLRNGEDAPLGPRGPNGEPRRRTSEVVGEALGLSRRTYDRAKEVIGATEDDDPIVAEICERNEREIPAYSVGFEKERVEGGTSLVGSYLPLASLANAADTESGQLGWESARALHTELSALPGRCQECAQHVATMGHASGCKVAR